MNEFIRLKPDEYARHCIVDPVSFNGKVYWYSDTKLYNSWVKWLLLAFLMPAENPDTLIFQMCFFDEDYFVYPEIEGKKFDPLHHSASGAMLKPQSVKEIAELLKHHADELIDVPEEPETSMFEQILETEWPKWRLARDVPNEKIIFYRQMYDPLDINNSSGFTMIVDISKIGDMSSNASSDISVGVESFSKYKLSNPDYSPLNDVRFGHINLDRKGAYELAQLIEEGLSILTCPLQKSG
ncbi:MAG: hypothetical protein GY797_23045 [Deltaproteobacteria bacterium]|nr:hypothetical protein [Deltaproteobacteria bacterium]